MHRFINKLSFITILLFLILLSVTKNSYAANPQITSNSNQIKYGETLDVVVTGLEKNKIYRWEEFLNGISKYKDCTTSDNNGLIAGRHLGSFSVNGQLRLVITLVFTSCSNPGIKVVEKTFALVPFQPVPSGNTTNPSPSATPSLVGGILTSKDIVSPDFNFGGNKSLGDVLSAANQILFYIALFVALYWLSWGIFEYLFAGGAKEKLAGARKRITWAIVGLIFVLLAFLIAQYAAQIILPAGSNQPAETLPIFSGGNSQ